MDYQRFVVRKPASGDLSELRSDISFKVVHSFNFNENQISVKGNRILKRYYTFNAVMEGIKEGDTLYLIYDKGQAYGYLLFNRNFLYDMSFGREKVDGEIGTIVQHVIAQYDHPYSSTVHILVNPENKSALRYYLRTVEGSYAPLTL